MRRRQVSRSSALPARLAFYVESEWSGVDAAERYGEWMRARGEWADSHQIEILPGDEEAWAAFPDGEWRPEDL